MIDVNGTPVTEGAVIREVDGREPRTATVACYDAATDSARAVMADGASEPLAGWMAEQFWEVVA